jgi:hypothetical protein
MSATVSQAIKRLRKEHAAWDEAKIPGDDWWKAVDNAIESIASATLGDNQLSLCDPICDMIDGRFRDDDENAKPGVPSRDLQAAIARLLDAKPRVWPELETIKQLDREKVRHSQIAKMHGLTVGLVQSILDGEKEYPAGHVTPHDQEQRRSKRQLRDRMRLAFLRYQQMKQIAEIDTVADFIDEGATLGEIAEAFDADPDAVIAEARSLGHQIEVPGMSEDEQIYSLADQGIATPEIAEMLGTTVQKVAGALHRREITPEVRKQRKVKKKVRAAARVAAKTAQW